jgi:hypothetical protein
MPVVSTNQSIAELLSALPEDATEVTIVRYTRGGPRGPGLASRRPVIDTTGVSIDVAPVLDFAAAKARRTA